MSRRAVPIVLSEKEQVQLSEWSRGRSLAQRQVQRAKIILLAARGVFSKDIAQQLGISRPTVQKWRQRFLDQRIPGIERDARRPGRKRKLSDDKVKAIVNATLHTRPEDATHWTIRTMARAQGVSHMMVQRIWHRHHLKPHLIRRFKVSKDQAFVEKVRDVVGLYLNPPDKALVLCVDEKSQIQALDRTQPGLPLKRGRCGTMTHDYKRNGTTTLFAALSLLDGRVIGECLPRHRHQEFIRFLKKIDRETPAGLDLHLIVDNYATHKHPRVKNWLKRHARFHLHHTPTSSSWLNLVERWLRELTEKRIRRGSFESVAVLVAAIEDYIKQNNRNPRMFVWTKTADEIIRQHAICQQALVTLH